MGAGGETCGWMLRTRHPAQNRPFYCGHVLIAPEVLFRSQVLGTADPGAGGTGVGADEIRLGCRDLRGIFSSGWTSVSGPENGLGDGHVKEVFPRFGLELFHLLLVGLGVVLVGRPRSSGWLLPSSCRSGPDLRTHRACPDQLRRLAGMGFTAP